MSEAMFLMQRYWGSDEEDSYDSGIDNKTESDFHVKENALQSEKVNLVSDSSYIKKEIHNKTITSYSEEQIKDDANTDEHVKIKFNDAEALSEANKKGKEKRKKRKKVEVYENESEIKHNENETPSTQDGSENFRTIGQIKQPSNLKSKRTLPQWLSKPIIIGVNLEEENTSISELSYLDENTKRNLESAGIQFLFPVQLAVIPWLMQCSHHYLLVRPSDLCVSAPTGSGKTLAFVIPIVQSLKNRVACAVRALVVLPVNELAIQVYKVFETFIKGTDLKVVLLTGQKSFFSEQNLLVKRGIREMQSLVDIVVTTPGRILDHIHRTDGFSLKHLRYLVIDEADRMMEEIQQGWLKQIENAVHNVSQNSACSCYSVPSERIYFNPTSACHFGFVTQPLQKLLYSATLSHDPEKLHTLSLYRPKLFTSLSPSEAEEEWIGKCPVPSSLVMLQAVCDNGIKPMVVCHLMKQYGFSKVLCFTETVERAHRLHLVLEEMGLLQVREISSFNRPVQRKIVLEQFIMGKVNILICSDLVSRGIDIENVDCVLSYDVPQYVKTYIHRIGRTARAGKTGTAITLLSVDESPLFKKMLKSAGLKVPEQIHINAKDLEIYVTSFQQSLAAADAKLKKEKATINSSFQKRKKKRTETYSKYSK